MQIIIYKRVGVCNGCNMFIICLSNRAHTPSFNENLVRSFKCWGLCATVYWVSNIRPTAPFVHRLINIGKFFKAFPDNCTKHLKSVVLPTWKPRPRTTQAGQGWHRFIQVRRGDHLVSNVLEILWIQYLFDVACSTNTFRTPKVKC